MAFKTFNRVKLTLTGAPTPPTGVLNLSSASSGFQDLATAGAANGDVIPYVIEDGSSWEVGYGLYGSAGPTLTRSTIIASSNSGSAISCTADAIVSATILAENLNQNVIRIPGGQWTPLDFSSSTTSCLNSVALNFASQTFTLAAGNRLEIEAYVHASSGNSAGVYVMKGSSASTCLLMAAQGNGDWKLYEVSSTGGTYNAIASISTGQTYTGQFKINMNIVCLGSSNSMVDGSVDAFLTAPIHSTVPDLSGALSIAVFTDAYASCSGRARLLV